MRLIDADDLIEQINGTDFDTYRDYENVYDLIDSAEEVECFDFAHWVYGEYDIPHCSACGYEAMPNMISPFCPVCGAKMMEGADDDE